MGQQIDVILPHRLDFLTKSWYVVCIMSAAMIKHIQYLKENGFTDRQANAVIYVHRESIEATMASKRDIEQLRSETKRDIADVRKEIAELRKEIAELRAETKRDLAEVRKDIEQLRAEVKQDLLILKQDLTLKLGSIMTAGVVVLGVLIAVL